MNQTAFFYNFRYYSIYNKKQITLAAIIRHKRYLFFGGRI